MPLEGVIENNIVKLKLNGHKGWILWHAFYLQISQIGCFVLIRLPNWNLARMRKATSENIKHVLNYFFNYFIIVSGFIITTWEVFIVF